MSEKALKFGDIVVNKKNKNFFRKQAIALNKVNTSKIVASYKFKHSDDGFKYLIGYSHDDDVIRPLCIILPQMSEYIKYFDNGGKNMSEISTEIWNKIENLSNAKFHSQPIYDDKYIKAKVKTFSSIINTFFSGDEIPKERSHYICIAAVCIGSVLRVEKINYAQVYLEQCKYKIKRRKPVDFIDAEVDLSSDDSEDLDE